MKIEMARMGVFLVFLLAAAWQDFHTFGRNVKKRLKEKKLTYDKHPVLRLSGCINRYGIKTYSVSQRKRSAVRKAGVRV